jgi:SAM-dependent methyltransferase
MAETSNYDSRTISHNCEWKHLCKAPSNDDSSVWALSRCEECGLVRLAEVPGRETSYPSDYYGEGEAKFVPVIEAISHIRPVLMSYAIHRCSDVARTEKRRPRVLDVGCGRAYLLRDLAAKGWDCAGIDIQGSPVPRNAESLGLDCRIGDASDLPWPSGVFDLVVINHVLEHTVDPWAVCREARRVLRDKGILYVGVPNVLSFQSRLFGVNWFSLELPRHVFHFSPRSLATLLRSAGLRMDLCSTRSFRQGVFAWIQSTLNVIDRSSPNRLLGILKGQVSAMSFASAVHLSIACALAPLGLLEVCLASLLGHGSVLAVVCSKGTGCPRQPVGDRYG